jgi:signal transduction histidine kinase
MEITDSGKGFDQSTVPTGLGLTAMEERVRMMNGDFKIQSAPGAGTTITTSIALPKDDELVSTEVSSSSAARP